MISSVCVYCGSATGDDPAYVEAAAAFGRILAAEGLKLVYGGGGVGLMGACARAAHEAGGEVLGVMPSFLQGWEQPYDDVETVIVESMHQRKKLMFDSADAFAVFPGGVGTLEEAVELMSWRRLALHQKPLVFYNPAGYWDPLFALIGHTIDRGFSPAWFPETWSASDRVGDLLPALRAMAHEEPPTAVPGATRFT